MGFRHLTNALLMATMVSVALCAETFVNTKVMPGIGNDNLLYEAELVDDVDQHLEAHQRFLETSSSVRVQTVHEHSAFMDAELVDDLDDHFEDQPRFVQFTEHVATRDDVPLTPASAAAGTDFIEVSGVSSGYNPIASEFDNPLTDTKPVAILESAPDCTVRATTVLEVQKLRASSFELKTSIEKEVVAMHKRKAYVEQMTQYLNDRIRDLNKVKSELATEIRWVQATSDKIEELAHQEQLIKYQDVLSCLEVEKQNAASDSTSKQAMITKLKAKSTKLESDITAIRTKILNTKNGVAEGAA